MSKHTIQADNRPVKYAQVALPVPLRALFDYRIMHDLNTPLNPGMRVVVPFGHRKLTGLLIKLNPDTELDPSRIRSVISVIDHEPIVSKPLFNLLLWVADYYQQPLGEVIKTAIPRIYEPKVSDQTKHYAVNPSVKIEQIPELLKRAPVQQQLFNLLLESNRAVCADQFKGEIGGWRSALESLIKKQIINVRYDSNPWCAQSKIETDSPPVLNDEQTKVIAQICENLDSFKVNLLKGVTGSGKTEVYLHIAQEILKRNKQILVLVPEIALTPQLIARFEKRLGFKAAVLHSSLSEKQRRLAWQAGASGQAKVVLGTRSAVFSALNNLGLIILDEEHDSSYKQHEGVRYHARDVAIMRAKLENLPIVMGSATPSLESLANVKRNRYSLCELNKRVGSALMPSIHLLDLDQLSIKHGMSITLLKALEKNLENKKQSLIFINRRGYAPVVICKQCGHSATCKHCHARLTYHHDGSLQCHHCGACHHSNERCQACDANTLIRLGQGTQRIEELLNRLFPKASIARLDRDAVSKKDQLDDILAKVTAKDIDILIGTQMLSKGHDFPDVTLVGVINADQGLFGLDFHSTESMIQQLIQVSGRAGRARNPGKVLIQTSFVDHPLYKHVSQQDYIGFAEAELELRNKAGFPPYYYLALVRASATTEELPMKFLQKLKRIGQNLLPDHPLMNIMDPVYSPMAKRQNRFRAQLLISSQSRSARDAFLKNWITIFESDKAVAGLRWSIDVDPLDLY